MTHATSPPDERGGDAIDRVWVASATALVVALTYHHMDLLGDSFFSIASGEWVLAHRALPDTDPFSFTSRHVPWLLYYPAVQIGFAWVARHAGLLGVIRVATLASAGAQLAFWLPHARSRMARVLGLFLVLASIEVSSEDLCARGQVFGDLCVAALLLVLFLLKEGRTVSGFVAFALGAAWTNVHPSFLLAVLVPPLVGVSTFLDPKDQRPPLRPFFTFGALALMGTGLSPHSFLIVLDVLRLSSDATTRAIDLFRSPDFRSPVWLAFAASAAGLLALRFRAGTSRHRRSETAMLAALLVAACFARRFGALLAGFEVAVALRLVGERELLPRAGARRTGLILVGLAAVQLAAAVWLFRRPKDPLAHVPHEAAAFIEAKALPERVWNPYHWGGYLQYAWQGRRKVFIDGRNLMFANGVFDDAREIALVGPRAAELLDTYEISTVLAERGSPLDAALHASGQWAPKLREGLGAVYVRRGTNPLLAAPR